MPGDCEQCATQALKLRELEERNRELANQVKRLVQVERDMYTVQELLDEQVRIYRTPSLIMS